MNLLPLGLRRWRRINRFFKTAGRVEPYRLRLVPPGPRTASPPPPAGASEGGSTPSAGLRTANARVGSPADLIRANHSSQRDLPSQGAVEVAGRPEHAPPQRRDRGSRGRGGLRSVPASATTRGSVSNAAPGASPPAPGPAFRVLPTADHAGPPTYDLSCRGPVPSFVGGRSSEAPQPENSTTPRPLLGQEQPGDHNNGRG